MTTGRFRHEISRCRVTHCGFHLAAGCWFASSPVLPPPSKLACLARISPPNKLFRR